MRPIFVRFTMLYEEYTRSGALFIFYMLNYNGVSPLAQHPCTQHLPNIIKQNSPHYALHGSQAPYLKVHVATPYPYESFYVIHHSSSSRLPHLHHVQICAFKLHTRLTQSWGFKRARCCTPSLTLKRVLSASTTYGIILVNLPRNTSAT
jgi:hypothetical protein